MGTIIYLKENKKLDDSLSIYGAVVKLRRKSYAISFQSLRYYEGDEITFEPKNIAFLEAKVKPTVEMIFEANQAIRKFRINYRNL